MAVRELNISAKARCSALAFASTLPQFFRWPRKPSANADLAHVDRKSGLRVLCQSLFAGKACKARLVRPNNSLKPSPLRGLGAARYDWTIANAAQRPGLAQALDRSRNKCRSTSVKPNGRLFFPRLAWRFEPRHKLRAG